MRGWLKMREIKVLTSDGIKKELVYSPDEIQDIYLDDIGELVRSKKITYINCVTTYDIETTTIVNNDIPSESYAFMYHWQFCINGIVFFGRTWKEYQKFIGYIRTKLELTYYKRLVIYVHNLAYEWQFIKNFFKWDEYFFRDKRKPLKLLSDGIEYRCSYFLSNKSLEKFIQSTPGNIYYKNSADEYDYSKIRTPSYKMSELEESYCYCDVRGLYESIKYLLTDDNIATIPLTSTGYVRRAVRRNNLNRNLFLEKRLTPKQYELCRKCFRGGNCHANRKKAGRILEGVRSKDETSAYPWALLYGDYPISAFFEIDKNRVNDMSYILGLCNRYCCIMDITLYNISTDAAIPYIDKGHCTGYYKIKNDNGRILNALMVRYCCTNIDFLIIIKTYKIKTIEINEMYYAEKGKIESGIRNAVLDFFDKKTLLKGVDEYEYLKSKNMLNAIFGMMVTDITHPEIWYDDYSGCYGIKDINVSIALDRYYKSRNSFLSYQDGIFVTANARLYLQRPLDVIGDDVVYCDTDSVKYIGNHDELFDSLNDIVVNAEIGMRKTSCDKNGNVYYMGRWEDDGYYKQFKTLGAKKYAYVDKNGDFAITVSGVNKLAGSKLIGSIDNFNLGRIVDSGYVDGCFYKSGRTVSYYNEDDIHSITVNGEDIVTASNIAILDTTYTIGISYEYSQLLSLQNL